MDGKMTQLMAIMTSAAVTTIAAIVFTMVFEPYPYRYVNVTVLEPVHEGDVVINVGVDLFRNRLCPYTIERTVYDSGDNKRFDDRDTFSAPKKLGAAQFGAPILLDSPIDAGQAIYSVRVGSMCNILQRIFPSWGPWYNATFEVLPRG